MSMPESLAAIEARYSQELPFIDDKGHAVVLVGDCVATVKNITASHLTVELSHKTPQEEEVEIDIPEATHGRGSQMFSDGMSPKKMIAGGVGSTVVGAGMIGGGYATNAIARVANTNSTQGSDGGTSTATLSGSLMLGGVGLVAGGLYNILRGSYRWVTGTAMTADISGALDNVKDAATNSMAAKFTKKA